MASNNIVIPHESAPYLIIDTFNRAAADLVGQSPDFHYLGNVWEQEVASALPGQTPHQFPRTNGVGSSNHLDWAETAFAVTDIVTIDAGVRPTEIMLDVNAPTTTHCRMFLRNDGLSRTGGGSFIEARITFTDATVPTVKWQSVTAGTAANISGAPDYTVATDIGTKTHTAGTYAPVKLKDDGSTITVYVGNGSHSIDTTLFNTNTYFGFVAQANTNNFFFKNFRLR